MSPTLLYIGSLNNVELLYEVDDSSTTLRADGSARRVDRPVGTHRGLRPPRVFDSEESLTARPYGLRPRTYGIVDRGVVSTYGIVDTIP